MPESQPVLRRRTAYRSHAGLLVVAALAWIALWWAAAALDLDVPPRWLWLAGPVPLALALLYAWLVNVYTEYRVYPDSIELEAGLIARRIMNLQLFRVRDLGLRQSILGRMVGVGDVLVTSTDQSTPRLLLRGVDGPRAVYDTLRELVARSQATRRTLIVEEEPGA